MDLLTIAALLAAGVAGGVITAVAGGASLVTFPALLAAGLPPVVANASNTTALMPGNIAAVLVDVRLLPRWGGRMAAIAAVCMLGSAAGAALLLLTPDHAFTALVPALLGTGTILFALSGHLHRWMSSPRPDGGTGPLRLAGIIWTLIPLSIYGGYFGAGMGVLLLTVLSLHFQADYRSANVLKNVVATLINVIAVLVFVSQGVIAWAPTLVMLVGVAFGGYLGGWVARIIPDGAMRALVIAIGAGLTVIYARRYWF